MAKKKDISHKDFEKLLTWLNKDNEIAGQKYENIRLRLIRIFTARGCNIAEELTDETIDRVINKIDFLKKEYEGDPTLYFYAVGKNVLSEFFKKAAPQELSPNLVYQEKVEEGESERLKCLRTCLQTLTKDQHNLIIGYYKKTKQEKIEYRRQLAEELGISSESLRIKAFRLRNSLQKCIERCVAKKNM